jgi:hypothetical protein
MAAAGLFPAVRPKRHATPVTTLMQYLGNSGAPVALAITYATTGITAKAKSATISCPRGLRSESASATDALVDISTRRVSDPISTALAGPNMEWYEWTNVPAVGRLKSAANIYDFAACNNGRETNIIEEESAMVPQTGQSGLCRMNVLQSSPQTRGTNTRHA